MVVDTVLIKKKNRSIRAIPAQTVAKVRKVFDSWELNIERLNIVCSITATKNPTTIATVFL